MLSTEITSWVGPLAGPCEWSGGNVETKKTREK